MKKWPLVFGPSLAITLRMPSALVFTVIEALGPPMSVFTQPGEITATTTLRDLRSLAAVAITMFSAALELR